MELPVPRLEPSPRWVRVRAGDQWVADSRRARITGLICFFNERVDLTIDGVLEAGPDTPWS